ncbi:MAG: hypothetical protein JW797_00465 [Bradymonadales bacterium]|nr:hypothetical protein [Bradymonadales bacterium]
MKRLGWFCSLVVIGTLLAAGNAMAQEQDWANKSGAFGVGANTSLGGTNGINIRTYVTPLLGIHLTFGMRFLTATVEPEDVDNAETEYSMTEFDFGLYGSYKVAYWQRGHLSVILGGDVQTFSEDINAPGRDNDSDRSSTNIVIGIGLLGEYFPTQYLSIFAQAGFLLNFIGDDDLACMRFDGGACSGLSALSGDPEDYDASGVGLSLSGQPWGAAGFTVWFR